MSYCSYTLMPCLRVRLFLTQLFLYKCKIHNFTFGNIWQLIYMQLKMGVVLNFQFYIFNIKQLHKFNTERRYQHHSLIVHRPRIVKYYISFSGHDMFVGRTNHIGTRLATWINGYRFDFYSSTPSFQCRQQMSTML